MLDVTSKREFKTLRRKLCSGGASTRNKWRICGKKCAQKMDEEVMEKYRVEESKKSACKGRGEPMYWRIFKNISLGMGKDCRARIYSCMSQGVKVATKQKHAGR